jgi:hypothetical protein
MDNVFIYFVLKRSLLCLASTAGANEIHHHGEAVGSSESSRSRDSLDHVIHLIM